MKKLIPLLGLILLLSSCYTSKVAVGNIKGDEPLVKVHTKKNHSIIFGLIPVGKNQVQHASSVVGEKTDYLLETQKTFVDGLLEWLTIGIYNPTTTSYYMPLELQ